jgi:hypothetical protein
MLITIHNTIKITNSNIKRYRSLGYNCVLGDSLMVDFDDLPSSTRLTYRCESCCDEFETNFATYKRSEYDLCQQCTVKEKARNNFNDYTNKKVGLLTITKKVSERYMGRVQWYCKCECGNNVIKTSKYLNKSPKPSCGCYQIKKATDRLVEGNKIRCGDKHPLWNPDLSESERKKRENNTGKIIKLRKDVYCRDNYTCYICSGKGVKLNAHHIIPWSISIEGRYDINNLITLCEKCHKKYHRTYKIKENNNITLKEFKNVCERTKN